MKRLRIAAILMIIHGGLIEMGSAFMAIPAIFNKSFDMSQFFSFGLQYLQDNITNVIFIGFIFGLLRVIGAVGVWKNRKWGLILSCINCTVTLTLMIFMLPAGITDGILATIPLVLMLITYFEKAPIIENKCTHNFV